MSLFPVTRTVERPEASEYAPYYDRYISLVAGNDLLGSLEREFVETLDLLRGVSEERAGFRYAPDKWSIRQVVGHLSDSERIFAYRALRIARNDKTPLSGFEQDDFVNAANFDDIPMAELVREFEYVRLANLQLFRQFTDEAWKRLGVANHVEISARALGYIISGHEIYHRAILRERYEVG
jgi:hypothetical protein